MRFFVQDPPMKERDKKACEKNNHSVEVPGQAGIYLIFRGLFFEHNAEIGQKGHLWMGTNYRTGGQIFCAHMDLA
jgi:hypothetical protein